MKADKTTLPPRGDSKFQDILYALFKHKWKIIFPTLLGLGAAGALYHHYNQSPTYETHAKLMVRYVVERREADPNAPVPKAGSVMMDSEQQILTSFDVAKAAAEAMGAEKVLPDHPGEPSVTEAGARITMNLAAESKRGSNVILVKYRDSDPQRAVDILDHVIQSYFARHLEIHRSTGAFDQVRVQAEQARSALRVIEDQINTLKSKSGVLSVDATVTEFETRRQQYRSFLMESEAVLAQQRAKVAALTNSAPTRDAADVADGSVVAIDPAQAAEDETKRRVMTVAMFEYQGLASRLAMLRQERDRLLVQRPATHPMIQSLNGQIAQVQRQSLDLTERYPEFAGRGTEKGQTMGSATTIEEERALEAAFEAKVKSIRDEVAMIEGQVENLSKLGFQLGDLERRRGMQEQKYRYYQTSLEKAEVDERLDPSKIPNISIVESPSNPVRSLAEATMVIIGSVASSGLVLGLLMAFLIEFVLRRRVTKPGDIRNRLQLPLLMTIPYIRSRDAIEKLTAVDVGLIGNSEDPLVPSPGLLARPVSKNKADKRHEKEHFITPFARAIHDRIIFNFEINNLTHKPKLVAFAGLTAGAGTSTVAAGVAKAFSEEGNRKILLVDLNPAAKNLQSYGHPADSLRRAIEHSQCGDFLRDRQNLHFASAPTRRNGNGNAALAPIALQEIMPLLQASDFDYIIFDMPHVDSTSPTLSMAGFMDKVLLVVDGESTTPENLRWAYSELERGRADVSCIFNKAKNHAPRWVLDEA